MGLTAVYLLENDPHYLVRGAAAKAIADITNGAEYGANLISAVQADSSVYVREAAI